MTTTILGPSQALAQLFTPQGKRNPYPLYRSLWQLGPVFPVRPRLTIVLGHAECSTALRDPTVLVTDANVLHRDTDMLEHSSWQGFTKIMTFCNDPEHRRLRNFAREFYNARSAEQLRPAVKRLCADVLERLASHRRHTVDLVREFAFEVSMAVTGDLLGIPAVDRITLREAITACTTAFEPILSPDELAPGDGGMDRLVTYMDSLLRQQKRAPTNNIAGAMAQKRDIGGEVSDDELHASLVMFLMAGVQTPSDLIGNAVRLALQHPDQTANTQRFVTETLRFDPPIHAIPRYASEEINIGGSRIPAGSRVLLILAAANRDARSFDDPDRFDTARAASEPQPLSFGLGMHYCLGAALARMQAETALPMLLAAFPRMSITGDPIYRSQLVQRGHARLQVMLDSAACDPHRQRRPAARHPRRRALSPDR